MRKVAHNTEMRKLGLIAGQGGLPAMIATKHQPAIVTFDAASFQPAFAGLSHLQCDIARIGEILAFFRAQHVSHIAMAGHIQRPNLKALKPDGTGAKLLASLLLSRGDDGLLTQVGKFIEKQGFTLLGADQLLPELLLKKGTHSTHKPSKAQKKSIERGQDYLHTASRFDIGQAVIVQEQRILGVEGPEGTDALIVRCADLRKEGEAPILIKLPKQGQELRVDMPTIGSSTIAACHKAGIGGIAIAAEQVLVIEPEQVIAEANEAGLFLHAVGV